MRSRSLLVIVSMLLLLGISQGQSSNNDAKRQEMTSKVDQDKNSEAAKLVELTNEWTDAINQRNRQKLEALMAFPISRCTIGTVS